MLGALEREQRVLGIHALLDQVRERRAIALRERVDTNVQAVEQRPGDPVHIGRVRLRADLARLHPLLDPARRLLERVDDVVLPAQGLRPQRLDDRVHALADRDSALAHVARDPLDHRD